LFLIRQCSKPRSSFADLDVFERGGELASVMLYEKVVKGLVLVSFDDVFYNFRGELFEVLLGARLEGYELIKVR
jgi:hypothetical protein